MTIAIHSVRHSQLTASHLYIYRYIVYCTHVYHCWMLLKITHTYIGIYLYVYIYTYRMYIYNKQTDHMRPQKRNKLVDRAATTDSRQYICKMCLYVIDRHNRNKQLYLQYAGTKIQSFWLSVFFYIEINLLCCSFHFIIIAINILTIVLRETLPLLLLSSLSAVKKNKIPYIRWSRPGLLARFFSKRCLGYLYNIC